MSESMVERVARAIEQTYDLYSDPTPAQRARAAIEAMREPTDDMGDAGGIKMHAGMASAKEVYQAMIDDALAPAKVE